MFRAHMYRVMLKDVAQLQAVHVDIKVREMPEAEKNLYSDLVVLVCA